MSAVEINARPTYAADEECSALTFPCSAEQRRIWLLEQLKPLDTALHISTRWRIDGVIAHAQLENVFRQTIARHSILRTSFSVMDDEPVQTVAVAVPFRIALVDLANLPESKAIAEAERVALLEAQTSFDFSMAPLLRVTRLGIRSDFSILLVTAHQMICDAVSLQLLAKEVSEQCNAISTARAPLLPYLPLSYGDYAASQVAVQRSKDASTEADFWKRTLTGIRFTEMPADRSSSITSSAHRESRSISLDLRLTESLLTIIRQQSCSVFSLALASLSALLHRHTGDTDIAIESQTDERDAEFKNAIGPFSKTLFLRNDLSGDVKFTQLLSGTYANCNDAVEHQRIPLAQLISCLKPKRDEGISSARVSLIFRETFISDRLCEQFSILNFPRENVLNGNGLVFIWQHSTDGWRISCEFNPELFGCSNVESLLKRFRMLLASIASNPQQSLSRLTMLTPEEIRELVVDYNKTAADYPVNLTLPQLFSVQAKLTPDACAVVCGNQTITYRDLDAASNRLARELRARGLAPATRIGVLLERSLELPIALLAILKSGSAYIPLDPNYPHERLLHIFDNAKPAAIISRTSLQKNLPSADLPALLLDRDALAIAKQSATQLADTPCVQDLAYLIYTSGSTGVPKGVQINHRAVVNFLWSMRREPGLTALDTLLAVTTVSFDIAVLEIFLPLIVGAKLVLAKENEVVEGRVLLELLQRHQATVMQATPVTWQLLIDAGWDRDPRLKMLCGGEALQRKLAENLLARGKELWNMYGPTETTVWSSALRVESGIGDVLIGPPIANTQFYVLDRHQQLAPPGMQGELYIGGDGIGQGYFNLPLVTREKFLPDPFRSTMSGKLYRTGDIVRMRRCAKGFGLEYLGRADQQVKLRGFRIELGEIEAVLMRHPDVAQAVAILGETYTGESAIYAYIVPRVSVAIENLRAELRSNLEKSLPTYMHPAAVVALTELPRMPNGKIDRAALRHQMQDRRMLAHEHRIQEHSLQEESKPRNEIEARLVSLWSDVLGLIEIETTADFFALGGHSILAARLLTRIEAEFDRKLTLTMLFAAPSIRAQAELLAHSDARQYDFRQIVRLHPEGAKPPLIAINNTGVYYYHLSKQLGVDQPLAALQLFDPLTNRDQSPNRLPNRLEDIAAGYVQLVRQLQPSGPYQLIGWCIGGVLAFEVACQLVAQGEQVSFLGLIDAWAPGHLRRISRLRAALFDGSYRTQLILTDWRRVLSGQQSVREFLVNRALVKRILRWAGRSREEELHHVDFSKRDVSSEHYDQWLQGYLEQAEMRYTPKRYSGRVTLFCSSKEPRGLFLDPLMGWQPFAAEVAVEMLTGDHFTLFQGQGLEKMARTINMALADRRQLCGAV